MNEWIIPASIVLAVITSSVVKEIIHFSKNNTFSWYTLLLETGGMPSTHSAAVSALTTSIYYTQGLSALFWASLVFAAIIVRDAFGVRKSVSDQAQIINTLLSQTTIEKKVHIILGHTPLQATIGVLVGISSATLIWVLF